MSYNLHEIRERPLIRKYLVEDPSGGFRPNECFLVVPATAWNELANIDESYKEALIDLNRKYSLAVINVVNRDAADVYYWSSRNKVYYPITSITSLQNYGLPNAKLTLTVGGLERSVDYYNVCPNTADIIEQTPARYIAPS